MNISDMTLTFNLSQEPAFKFSLGEFGDKISQDMKVSERFLKEVLYIESRDTRFEISYDMKKEVFQVMKVNDPYDKGIDFMKSMKNIPLDSQYVSSV